MPFIFGGGRGDGSEATLDPWSSQEWRSSEVAEVWCYIPDEKAISLAGSVRFAREVQIYSNS